LGVSPHAAFRRLLIQDIASTKMPFQF